MKGFRWAPLALGIVAMLTGCSGFWDKSGGGGGGGGTASGVFYVMSPAKAQVIGYGFSTGSTTPTAVSNGTVTFSAAPQAMAISPNGGFLYVSAGGIFVYAIGSNGSLTAVNNGNNGNISSDLPTAMTVDASGTWLIESLNGTGVLSAIPISSSTGLLDTARTVQTVTLPSAVLSGIATTASTATNPYVFLAMGSGGTEVIPFTANSTGSPFGTLSHIALKSSTGGATAIAVDATNNLLYVGETAAVTGTQTGGLRVYTIGTKITEVSGSPYASQGTGPSAILPSASGGFVYVANRAVSGASTGNIAAYPINISGGSYSLGTLVGTVNAGTATAGMAEDSTKTYVLAVNASGGPDLNTYTFDKTTSGKLDAGATVSSSLTPTAIAAVP